MLHSALLTFKFLTSNHKSEAKCIFLSYQDHYWLSTGEAIKVPQEDKVGITSKGSEAN